MLVVFTILFLLTTASDDFSDLMVGVNLSVHHPPSLISALKEDNEYAGEGATGHLKARLANFGHLEYGTSFLGKVYYAEEEGVR